MHSGKVVPLGYITRWQGGGGRGDSIDFSYVKKGLSPLSFPRGLLALSTCKITMTIRALTFLLPNSPPRKWSGKRLHRKGDRINSKVFPRSRKDQRQELESSRQSCNSASCFKKNPRKTEFPAQSNSVLYNSSMFVGS